ncbi:MAG: ATP-grasp domain-containing protein [Methanobacterium sp.]|nr:ATP-grasp domain-containing protein [Methanobacterium sp.]
MENVLVVGVNTRAVACSLKRRGYNVYSADYFGVVDISPCADQYKSFLGQTPGRSCGQFTNTFQSKAIEELASEFVDKADKIICLAGVSPEHFPRDKVMGNYQVQEVDDKYLLYQKLKNKFQIPDTFKVSSIGEAYEIAGNHLEKNFILKPRNGSGGYGIREFNEEAQNVNNDLILQEKIDGINLSASVLATGGECKTILSSQQIIGDKNLYQREPFGYCGNITPYTDRKVNKNLMATSEEIIQDLGLVGSCGVDYIFKDNEIFLLEVNPRLQGTMECAELSLNINMAEAHLEACQGNLMPVSRPVKFAVKMIVHSKTRSRTGDLDLPDVYDLPAQNVIIEEGEPVVTVITADEIRENALLKAHSTLEKVYNNLNPV